ncbi:hypothetical protein R1sor_001277 [Riccia sorocarpa]|uniref:Uncharacterized protein n=1 Tax=Riccia sorocarpa TaxID=122646 RepID=A0ABD3GYM3_9MARC
MSGKITKLRGTLEYERELNMRIVGLAESPEENTSEVVLEFFKDVLRVGNPRIEKASRVGRNETGTRSILGGTDLWASADLVLLVETWDQRDSIVELPGFDRVTSVWNQRKAGRGRGYGGIGVWARKNLPFQLEVVKEIIRLREIGSVWAVSDFNSRIGTAQESSSSDGAIWRTDENLKDWSWVSAESNRFSGYFLQFLAVSGLTVLNGLQRYSDTHRFTFRSALGQSCIDFLLASPDARIVSFLLVCSLSNLNPTTVPFCFKFLALVVRRLNGKRLFGTVILALLTGLVTLLYWRHV